MKKGHCLHFWELGVIAMSLTEGRGEAKQIFWRGKEVLIADKKGVSHFLSVWSKGQYSYMLL